MKKQVVTDYRSRECLWRTEAENVEIAKSSRKIMDESLEN